MKHLRTTLSALVAAAGLWVALALVWRLFKPWDGRWAAIFTCVGAIALQCLPIVGGFLAAVRPESAGEPRFSRGWLAWFAGSVAALWFGLSLT